VISGFQIKKARKNEDFCRKGYANSTKEKFVSGDPADKLESFWQG